MAEFMVNISGLKEAVLNEEEMEKELQKQIDNIKCIMTSSLLRSQTYRDISESLKITLTQLQDANKGVKDYKNCLIEIITLYEKTEKSIAGNEIVKGQLEKSRKNLETMLENLMQQEKYGENDESSQMSEDPVNLSTGNFIYDHVDIMISGEIPLSFKRFYNALDTRKGSLGVGFLHNYEICIEAEKNKSSIIVCMGDGQRKAFIKDENGNYLGERANLGFLELDERGYQLITVEGEHYYFDYNGVMQRQEDRNGRGISFCYDAGKKLLQSATNDNGCSLFYQYNSNNQLVSVCDETDRRVLLSYEDDLLKQVQMAGGETISYSYTEDGLMGTIENGQQVTVLRNCYRKDHRVSRQDFPDGGTMVFTYDDVNHCTTLTERNGSRISYIQDKKYRNTDIIYQDGTKEQFEYNGKNQKIKTVDRNGNRCRMAYDSRGNLTQLTYESGLKINYTYDSNNCLLCLKINGKEKLHNTYDAKGNLILAVNADGAASKITYDERGRAVKIEEAGKVTQLCYDDAGNVNKVIDALGNETTYVYDKLGRAIQTTDANGAETLYAYDKQDRLVCVINPLGAERKYSYITTGKVEEVIDFDGYGLKVSYNCLDKVETYTDKEGNKTHFTYDKMWNIASKTTPDGAVMEYCYNGNNRISQISLMEEGTITYEYDGNGNRIAEIDPEGNRTVFTYDAQNRRATVTQADGETTSYEYDEDGNLVTVCDALGNRYIYTYDEMGRKTSEKDPLGNVIKYTYCRGGKIDRIVYPNGSCQKFEYDMLCRVRKVTKPDATTTSFKYDKVGNIIEETNNLGQSYVYTYDVMNRMTEMTGPNGGRRRFSYDAIGHVTKMIDGKGNETGYTYSPNGNLTRVIDANGNEARYEYDRMNRLIKVEQYGEKGENQITAYGWNKAGKVISMTDPLGYQEVYSYNRNGMLQAKTDRDGNCTAYGYDKVGNLTDVLYQDGKKAVFSYNALRQLKEVEDWLGKTCIELDALGRPLSVTNSDGKMIQYCWGNVAHQTDMIYPNGTNLHYEYDVVGRLKELSDGVSTTAYIYDEGGRLAEKILPNGINSAYSYNELGRIESLSHTGTEFAESYHFTYDVNGNKIEVVHKTNEGIDAGGSFTYEYDAANQLVKVNSENQTVRTYAYDAFGNRIEKQDYTIGGMVHTRYRYNSKNQLILEESNDILNAVKEYSYDGRGNFVQMIQEGEIRKQFEFDGANQLYASFGAENDRTKAVRYFYNGLGHCARRETFKENTVGNVQSLSKKNIADDHLKTQQHYLLDLTREYNNLLEIQDGLSGEEQRFVWDSNVIYIQEEEEKSFYLQDVQGTVTGLADCMGRRKEHYEFDEFGILLNENTVSASQPFGFTGYLMEPVGGVYFAQARRYDALTGRFISEDKIRGSIVAPFTLNHYGYCWNRPVDMVDLNGMFPFWDNVKDWWNKNVYGEETVVKITTGEIEGGMGIYTGAVKDTTVSSEQYTGKILKRTTTIENDQTLNQYSVNIPTFDFGDGWKWGIPTSLGVTLGTGGVSLDADVGIDLGKVNVNVPASVGLSWEDIVSFDLGVNGGWDNNSVGLDIGLALNAFSNIKIGGHHTNTNGETSITEKAGVYMRTGYVYAVAIAVRSLYGMYTGTMDASTAWNSIIQYIQSLANGVCPVK